MKKIYYLLLLFVTPLMTNTLQAEPEVTPALQEVLSEKGEEDFISVNLRLTAQYDQDELYRASRTFRDGALRRSYVVNELKQFSAETQQELLDYLYDMEATGKVRAIRPLWIGNLVNCEARPEVIHELMTRKDLARIDYNKMRMVLMTDAHLSGAPVAKPDNIRTPDNLAWNVTLVNADQVWAEGFTGEGAIVAVMDTGINYNHHDITDNMWEHPDYPNHGYNFVNNNHNTMDYQSHGTHCAGTVAGTGAAGTGTGIAPGATIMNLKVLDDGGSGTEAGVWAGIEFAVEYGAHVMSLSLGWQHSWGPDRSMWRTTMNNALSAGVIAAVAAGNEGQWGSPPPGQVRTPGDVPPPWRHPDQIADGAPSAVVSVGSTTISDALSGFSSKGPVTWQNIAPFNDYPHNPGTGLIRPDVTAPGSDILSLAHNNVTGYTVKSGTSMATPAVAGLMALMISKNPNLTPEDISQIIEESAIPMTDGKSNTFGSGRIDALAAINQTPFMGITYVEHILDDSAGNNNGIINPGEYIKLNIAFENPTDEDIPNVMITLDVESPFITLSNNSFFIDNFPAEQTIMFDEIFSFQVSPGIHGNHEVEFVLTTYSQDDPDDPLVSSFIEVSEAPELVFSNIVIDDSEGGNNDGHLDPGETAWLSVTMTNNGQMATTPGAAFLVSENHWIAVLSYEHQSIPGLDPGESMDLQFEVAAFHDTPLESAAELLFSAVTEDQEYAQPKSIIVGAAPYYTDGAIPSTLHYFVTTGSSAVHPGNMTINIPDGATITGVDVEYSITSRLGVHMSQQQSFLRCISPGGTTEPQVYQGSGNTTGTQEYARQGLTIANNVQGGGDIQFQLHVFRTNGGFGSNTTYVFVPDSTWKLIVYYEVPDYDVTFRVTNQLEELVTGAEVIIGNTTKITNEEGEAHFELPEGTLFYSVIAENHRPLMVQPFDVTQNDNLIEVSIMRVFHANFNIVDTFGNPVPNAIITVNDIPHEPGNYLIDDLETGTYNFFVEAEEFYGYEGTFEITDHDIVVDVTLDPTSTNQVHFDVKDENGHPVSDAIITFNDLENNPGDYVFHNVPPGIHSFSVSRMCFLSYEGEVTMEEQNVQVTVVLSTLPGDANADGIVNVLDIIGIVSYFLQEDVQPFCFDNADINNDGVIDILDVIAVVNIFANDKIIVQPGLKSEEANLFMENENIYLESDGTLAGLQFELSGDNLHTMNLKIELPGFEFDYVITEDRLKAIIYSFDNKPLPQGKIRLLSHHGANNLLNWEQAKAGNINAIEVDVHTHDDTPTSANDIALNDKVEVYPNPASDKVTISFYAGTDTSVKLLNTAGQSLKNLFVPAAEGQVSLDIDVSGIRPGVYFLSINNHLRRTHKLIIQ